MVMAVALPVHALRGSVYLAIASGLGLARRDPGRKGRDDRPGLEFEEAVAGE